LLPLVAEAVHQPPAPEVTDMLNAQLSLVEKETDNSLFLWVKVKPLAMIFSSILISDLMTSGWGGVGTTGSSPPLQADRLRKVATHAIPIIRSVFIGSVFSLFLFKKFNHFKYKQKDSLMQGN
jgi:hypothetical protein